MGFFLGESVSKAARLLSREGLAAEEHRQALLEQQMDYAMSKEELIELFSRSFAEAIQRSHQELLER